jgi:uncharacterized protein (TIGR02266 family)
MSGRVLVVGLERSVYRKMEPILTRSLLTVDRVPKGESGLLLTGNVGFDLVVVRHPLPDMALGTFIGRVHEPGAPCGSSPILVLADEVGLQQVKDMLPGGNKTVFSINQPAKLLQKVASELLGVAPRADARVMMRLEVKLAGNTSLLTCQTENVSEGGMLLRMDNPPPLGTRVKFTCTLPGDRQQIEGEAEVMRHTSSDLEVQGMGLKIAYVKGDGARRLKAFVQKQAPA